MESQVQYLPSARPACCPFHDGPATLDGLLAELSPAEAAALDVALDLRSALNARQDAEQCVALALRLRHTLDGQHYLAFYRVRQWLQRVICVQVRAFRGEPWQRHSLPLNSARLDEIENSCLAAWAVAHPEAAVEWAQVRFSFLTDHTPVSASVKAASLAA